MSKGGNWIFGVHINGIRGKDQRVKSLGANPFDYLGLRVSEDGRKGTPIEWDGQKWITYSELGSFGINEQPIDKRGKGLRLSHWLPVYDWTADNGFENFNSWVS